MLANLVVYVTSRIKLTYKSFLTSMSIAHPFSLPNLLFFCTTKRASLNKASLCDITLGCMLGMSAAIHSNILVLAINTLSKAHSWLSIKLIPMDVICLSVLPRLNDFTSSKGSSGPQYWYEGLGHHWYLQAPDLSVGDEGFKFQPLHVTFSGYLLISLYGTDCSPIRWKFHG